MMSGPEYGAGQEPARVRFASPENEAGIIGALLVNNAQFESVVEIVDAADFSDPLNQTLFALIQAQIARGHNVTPITLFPHLQTGDETRDREVRAYLAGTTGSGAVAYGAKDFAREVARLARLRRLYDGAGEILERMRDTVGGDLDAAALAAELESVAFSASASRNERTRSLTMADAIDRVVDRIGEIQRTGEPIGAIAPDIPEMTKVVGPLERGHMHVWAGRPGMGKSALACGAARSMATAGYGCLFVSLEMSDIDLGQRFAADVAWAAGEKVRHSAIRDAKLSNRELRVLARCAEEVRAVPLKLVDVAGINVARLGLILRRAKREFEAKGQSFDVAFVDYLQLLSADRATDNRVSDMTSVSNAIKRLAKELQIAIVAMSQLSREVEKRENKRPQLSDLRETGAIEQDADTVCFLYRHAYYLPGLEPDKKAKPTAWEAWAESVEKTKLDLELIVPKRRNGATGHATVQFLGEYQVVRGRDHIGGALFDGA